MHTHTHTFPHRPTLPAYHWRHLQRVPENRGIRQSRRVRGEWRGVNEAGHGENLGIMSMQSPQWLGMRSHLLHQQSAHYPRNRNPISTWTQKTRSGTQKTRSGTSCPTTQGLKSPSSFIPNSGPFPSLLFFQEVVHWRDQSLSPPKGDLWGVSLLLNVLTPTVTDSHMHSAFPSLKATMTMEKRCENKSRWMESCTLYYYAWRWAREVFSIRLSHTTVHLWNHTCWIHVQYNMHAVWKVRARDNIGSRMWSQI